MRCFWSERSMRRHLRADSDDFSDHVVGWMLAGRYWAEELGSMSSSRSHSYRWFHSWHEFDEVNRMHVVEDGHREINAVVCYRKRYPTLSLCERMGHPHSC